MQLPNDKALKDIFQIVLFGKGYGESILIHIGNDNYILIDSFKNPQTNAPIAIDYLLNVGLNENAIVGIICSHWDNDHIQGIASIASKIQKPIDVYIPIAQSSRDFERFVTFLQTNNNPEEPYSTSEYINLLKLNEQKKIHICYTKAYTLLFPNLLSQMGKDSASIVALSPSEETVNSFISAISLPREKDYIKNIRISNNNISIVTLISRIVDNVLFGGDLENTNNDWDIIASNYAFDEKCHVFKIPHHGSKNAYSEKVWERMIEKPISIITRFNPSNLPTEENIDLIKKQSEKVYIIGGESKEDKKTGVKLKGTESDIRNNIRIIDKKIGLIRLSWKEKNWKVEKFGEVKEY